MYKIIFGLLVFIFFNFCFVKVKQHKDFNTINNDISTNNIDTIVLGNGCFWCTEAVYDLLDGVISTTSGYSGGNKFSANYQMVSKGTTNHAECIQLIYDTTKISIYEILEVFFLSHDPTTLNRQGSDIGKQYRSVIFYNNEHQKNASIRTIKELNKPEIYNGKIVTSLEELTMFYPAEEYHQNFYSNNKNYGYCRIVILPKIEKIKKAFKENLK